ncbi:hypothetical protein Chro_3765 [Chroococcidiopsis thermalis PCC 7203]|jgi:hypothetical protein|uniref:Uncharacterized protein n=1 Tax=Chroococcidiopsis thermalis (strain PCC 7203) TaxID=251229 RepID=K9U270_CHRTP|nr:hypothetical protein Chro_3765 [Chroococcidiopsis thermalis PCC 7203]
MRRRYKLPVAPSQNLDSFLDILTNTVGVLMFVSLFISLVAVQSATIVRTPLVSKTEKQPHFFEIRGNKVTYIDTKVAQSHIKELVESLTVCSKPIPPDSNLSDYDFFYEQLQEYYRWLQEYQDCITYKAQEFRTFQVRTSHYNVRLELEPFSEVYEPIEADVGESSKELKQENSEYKSILKKLSPQTDYLAFIVRPDSFETFRQAREIAWKDKFSVGWEPMKTDAQIRFSSGGRAVGVQ